MVVGSSRTEGLNAIVGGVQDWTKDYSALVANVLLSQGIDTCVSACSGSDYLIAGDGGQVPAYYPNAAGQTARWNVIDSGVSLLDSNSHISAYGSTNTEPKAIALDLFSNGATTGGDVTAMKAAMVACMKALRGAAPNAWIFIIVPSGFYYVPTYPAEYLTALNDAFSSYQSANPSDGRVQLIDIGHDLSMRITSAVDLYVNEDHVHPLEAGHALIAPVIMSGIQGALSSPTYQF
ncbi:SGNH/GDSL hydrolase family protein [Acetobacter sicerae]|uniref:SGNH/GDSL hydrolase family protein n=1 Tax=Acetobacter sicerae TaxID=85325 RepID=A0ABS8VUP0_9PROT|nr:SGNH/GDSL hydrolase family protein [Acetobacter sicerae]MCE0743334.1 SGNH/GDSL hydrolase family protein [Acetobacter sicerae]